MFTYQGFKRTFSFSFKVAAQSKKEMKPLYRKLNYLVSNLAPDYANNGRMRAPFIKLCIGAYMDRTPGFLTSMNLKWQKDYPWEIALNSPEGGDDSEMHVLPHVLNVSCNFTPIHDFVPRKSIEESPFIIPGSTSGLHTEGTNRKWLSGKDAKSQPTPDDSGDSTTNTQVTDNQNTDKNEKSTFVDPNIALTKAKSTVDILVGRILYPLDSPGTITESLGCDLNGDGINDIEIDLTVNYEPSGVSNVTIDITWNTQENMESVDLSTLNEYAFSLFNL